MRLTYHKWDKNQEKRLIQLRKMGVPIPDIARALAVTISAATSKSFLLKAGGRKDKELKRQRQAKVREMHAAGLTPKQMVAELKKMGGSSAQIYRDHKQLGLTPHLGKYVRVKPRI